MKRFRYMLCILGLSGLFSAYQFDAIATKTYDQYNDCDDNGWSYKYCKHRGSNHHKCPVGCYCVGASRKHTDPMDVETLCSSATDTRTEIEKQRMNAAHVFRCPQGCTSDKGGAKVESDCYVQSSTRIPCVKIPVQEGRFLPLRSSSPVPCTSGMLNDTYCPGGEYYPSKDEIRGVEPCPGNSVSSSTDNRKHCRLTCNAGYYVQPSSAICQICSNGYACPGITDIVVAGTGKATTDKGKYRCVNDAVPNSAKSACQVQCPAAEYLVDGTSSCATCPKGHRCPGMTQPYTLSLRPSGEWYADSSQGKQECNGGRQFQNQEGQTSCKNCPLGKKPNQDHTDCIDDPNFTQTTNSTAASRVDDSRIMCFNGQVGCPSKKYLKENGTNSSHCQTCPAGFYCPGGCFYSGNSQPQGRFECGPGKYSGANQAQCTNCINRQYSTGSHNNTYQLCNINNGNSFVGPNHDDCEACPAGTHVSENFESCVVENYTVTYDCGQYGTGSIPNGIAQYNQPFDPAPGTDCTALGNYSFDGWKVAGTNQMFNGTWEWTSGKTLVAQWVAGPATQYTVTFNCGNGGTGNPDPGSVTVETGGSINTPDSSACTRANHSYTQWKSGNLILPAGGSYTWLGNADDTMTPDWVQNTNCSVTYMCNGTSVGTFTYTTSSFNVEEGCDDLPDGRTFKWWVDSNGTHTLDGGYYSCNGASAVTLTAEYNDAQVNPGSGGGATTYTITYNCIYGTNPNPQTGIESGDHVTVLSATACEKPNYHYTRWSSSSAGYFDVDEVVSSWTHGDQTLVPDWEPDSTQNPNATTYTITYNCLNGTSLDPETGIQNGDDVQMPSAQACVKSGYHYTQWRSNYTGVGPFDADEVVSWTYGNRTLYPDWVSDGNNGGGNGGNTTTTVTSCPSGQYVPVGGTSCTNCPSGSFCPTAGTAVGGKSYSCFMGIPNNDHKTCRMVLDRDNMLHGLASGDDCWLKQMVDGPDGYKHCMFEGINQVQ